MNKYEFVHDQYVGINFEHNIGNGIFRLVRPTRKLKFRQFWTAKALWGSLIDANKALNFKRGIIFKRWMEKLIWKWELALIISFGCSE